MYKKIAITANEFENNFDECADNVINGKPIFVEKSGEYCVFLNIESLKAILKHSK